MNFKKSILPVFVIIGFFVLSSAKIFAQPDTSKVIGDTTNINNTLQKEKILENSQIDIEDSKLLDLLDELERNPYDLNTATQKELEKIPYINSIIAKRIIAYREDNKYFKSKSQLLKVDGITEDLYNDIKIYLVVRKSNLDYIIGDNGEVEKEEKVNKKRLLQNFQFRYRSRFQQELQPKEGFLDGDYPGSRAKVYNQFNGQFNNKNYSLE
jgi:hypothetical protein